MAIMNFKHVVTVAMVLTLFCVEVESLGGFRGELLETIQKSPHKIVHTMEVKAAHQSQVSLLCISNQN